MKGLGHLRLQALAGGCEELDHCDREVAVVVEVAVLAQSFFLQRQGDVRHQLRSG
ncbi:hypothetical protein D3C72_2353610 [compost metagenome]